MLLVFVVVSIALPQLLSYLHIAIARFNKRRHNTKSQQCQTTGPSYPHITGLLGLDFLYENAMNILNYRFAEGVRQRFKQYGTTHTARLLHRKMVNTIDPENLQAVMKTNFEDYTIIPGREKLMRVLFGVGVFGTDGHDWKHSRKLVRTAMSNLHLSQDVLEKHFDSMISTIRSFGKNGGEVDFGKVAFDYTLATAADVIIGGSDDEYVKDGSVDSKSNNVVDDIDQFGKDFSVLGKMARVLTIMISQIPYLTNIVYWNTYKPTQKRVFAYIDSRIQKAQSQPQPQLQDPISRQPTTLLSGLAAQTTDTTRVRSEALHLLLAGHDTVGIALSELFWCLSRSPQSWARLRADVASTLHGSPPSIADLKKMPYLNHIINEAIRVRPTLSVHGRRATKNTVLPRGGGPQGLDPLSISKGTYIVYSNYALYRNEAVFGSDVDTFRPERWEGPDACNPARYEFLNFGAGPRYCPGRELGWNMLAYVIVRLAQTVEEIGVPEGREEVWQEARAFSFHNRNGVKVRMSLDKNENVDVDVDVAGEGLSVAV